jgi:ribonuclease BN (tRNA processing enzyme)
LEGRDIQMRAAGEEFDLLFLGSGNAFGAEGRAFNCFLLNGRYLFDCGPTLCQQLRKASLPSDQIEAVFISHFHADHFFGLPFLFLDAWRNGREREFTVVGPPGIEQRSEQLMELAFPGLPTKMPFSRRYLEVDDGMEGEAAGLRFSAARVQHVAELDCFGFRVQAGSRSLAYSGDSRLCEGLLRLAAAADVLVLECSCGSEPVHLSPRDIEDVLRVTPPGSRTIVTHLDGIEHPDGFNGLLVAQDLARFCL